MKKIINNFTYLIAILFVAVSCDSFETDLEVRNLENPDDAILTSDPIALEAVAGTLFQNWYMANSNYYGVGMAMNTMADASSCSWGNAGMKDSSSEPRAAWNNTSSYGYNYVNFNPFNSMYSVLADSNNLALAIANGTEFPDNNQILAIAKFGQAITMGTLALNYDGVWLSDETGPIGDGKSDHNAAMAFAIGKLDEAIAIANGNSFAVPETWMPGTGVTSSADLAKLMNSFGARMLAMNSRNGTEKSSTNWGKVLSYANAGLTADFTISHDDVAWYDYFKTYLVYPGWARIDLRVINLMDPSYPDYWPAGETSLPPATSVDARLESDFQYLSSNNFRPNRGTYHFSSYRYARWNTYISEWVYPTVEFALAENDMYKAEAMLQTGDVAGAAAVINAGTRVSRGGLSPVAATAADVAAAIHYERMVEFPLHSSGLSFYEMRKEDMLQAGTLLHWPIPGKALEAIPADYYTYGGSEGVAGQDVSSGGWR